MLEAARDLFEAAPKVATALEQAAINSEAGGIKKEGGGEIKEAGNEEAEVKKENCFSMVQCKVMKQLELLEQRKFEDEDIQEDISFLMEKMNESVQVIIAVITFHT